MKITKAEFITSVANAEGILKDNPPEFAFVGRSNVGKSSLINWLTSKKDLAKTSKLPGRTRLVNYFSINSNQFCFVDLPGYGYHQAGKQYQDKWSSLIEQYLLTSKSLKRVFLLVDSRIKPTTLDKMMLSFLTYNSLPLTILATKCDKLPKTKIKPFLSNIANEMCVGVDNIIATSSENSLGKEKILEIIENNIS